MSSIYSEYIEYEGEKTKFGSVRIRLDSVMRTREKKHGIKIDRRGIANTMRKLARKNMVKTKERYELQIAPTGKPWQPLKNPKRYKAGKKILVSQEEKPHMRDSLVFKATATGFRVWSEDPKADLHQFGKNRSRGGNLPARPFLGISKQERREYSAQIKEVVMEQVKKNISFPKSLL